MLCLLLPRRFAGPSAASFDASPPPLLVLPPVVPCVTLNVHAALILYSVWPLWQKGDENSDGRIGRRRVRSTLPCPGPVLTLTRPWEY